MSTVRVTVTLDAGVHQDASDAAAEHGMSLSAWINKCTQLETMRAALRAHQAWCSADGLSGDSYEEDRASLAAAAAAELDRLADARRRGSDAA